MAPPGAAPARRRTSAEFLRKTGQKSAVPATQSATPARALNPTAARRTAGTGVEVSLLSERSSDPTQEAWTGMSDVLAAALRMMAPAEDRPTVTLDPCALLLRPATLSYADSVRRFDPASDPLVAVSHARAGLDDSDHLYQAHGEPRD